MIGRRALLRMLPGAGLAAKTVSDEIVAKLSGVNATGLGWASSQGPPSQGMDLTPGQTKSVISIYPKAADHLREILYETNRSVGQLDIDIANKRSFSLAAKITFQRQRNVETELKRIQEDYPWDRMQKILRSVLRS